MPVTTGLQHSCSAVSVTQQSEIKLCYTTGARVKTQVESEHVDYVLCKDNGFAVMTKNGPPYFLAFLHQTGSEENTNVKPYLCAAIVCCKSVTKASLLYKIALSLTIVK